MWAAKRERDSEWCEHSSEGYRGVDVSSRLIELFTRGLRVTGGGNIGRHGRGVWGVALKSHGT